MLGWESEILSFNNEVMLERIKIDGEVNVS